MKNAINKKQPSTVRIIGGEYRRRQIGFCEIDGLRPTPDRVRETLFNWLMHDIPNAKVLDCCAGSGVLGFEALSRGATYVAMIEPNQRQYQQLKKNALLLQIPKQKLDIYPECAEKILGQLPQKFDLVFLDPPYQANLWQILLEKIKPLIHVNSILYLEADRPHEQIMSVDIYQQLSLIKQNKFGNIWAGLYHDHHL